MTSVFMSLAPKSTILATMLATNNSPLHPKDILADLHVQRVPSTVVCYEQVSSTMDIVRERAAAGAAEGFLALAEEQTAGRGRMGRPWASPAGQNLYMSLLLRPAWLPPIDAFVLTMLVARSLCIAVESVTPLTARLKWPNDLLLPHAPGDSRLAKAAGILVELAFDKKMLSTAIIGCGINVNSHPSDAADLPYPATSIAASAGHPVDRLGLLRAFLQTFDVGYTALQAGRYDDVRSAWGARLVTIGANVRIDTPAGPIVGLVEGVAASGALLVREQDGTLRTVTTGDVRA